MQSLVNEPFLKTRANYARWGSYIGLGALAVGLMTTTSSPLLAYVFLLIGLLGASVGAYMSNRYVREPRVDQVLDEVLGSLDKRYAVYNYYLPSDHVIASHYGLTVIVPRSQRGEIRYENGRWYHRAGWRKLLQFFGQPSLGKPDQDAVEEIESLKKWIDEVVPSADIPVHGAIVFTNPNAELTLSEIPVPTMMAADLFDHMKQGLKGGPVLSTARQKELRRILDEVCAAS